ncbi:MAG TPA: hypothetical protein HPQ03_11445 [Deltaproteobacteria bacterium]|nr:hypothetical protein [Deltaproteobacteria bacterium]
MPSSKMFRPWWHPSWTADQKWNRKKETNETRKMAEIALEEVSADEK